MQGAGGCLAVVVIIIGLVILFTSPGLFIGLAIIGSLIWFAVRSSKKTSSKNTASQSYKQSYPKVTVSYQTNMAKKIYWMILVMFLFTFMD